MSHSKNLKHFLFFTTFEYRSRNDLISPLLTLLCPGHQNDEINKFN